MSAISLLEALNAYDGIMCFVGAGGKKTTLYRVAKCAKGRVAITATAHIERFSSSLPDKVVIAPEAELRDQVPKLTESRLIAYAQPSEKPGRYAGVSADAVARIHAGGQFDLTLVKADGARGRLVKAASDTEPVVPAETTTVVTLMSINALGQVLDDRHVHRVERFAAVTGATPGEPIAAKHLVQLLSSEQGVMKGADMAAVIPVINCVESTEQLAAARAIAEHALQLTKRYDRIVLASMLSPQPIVAVVQR